MRATKTQTEDDLILNVLELMEAGNLLEASRMVRHASLAFDLRSSVVLIMKFYKDFHGVPHASAKNFGL